MINLVKPTHTGFFPEHSMSAMLRACIECTYAISWGVLCFYPGDFTFV